MKQKLRPWEKLIYIYIYTATKKREKRPVIYKVAVLRFPRIKVSFLFIHLCTWSREGDEKGGEAVDCREV